MLGFFRSASLKKPWSGKSRRLPHEFFETEVRSFPKLVEEVKLLDVDSGIRTFGDYDEKERQFVFVTRSPHDTYTLMVYEKLGGRQKPTVGKRLAVKEFAEAQSLIGYMKSLVSKPVQAFVY
jgi:hypothetical protein